jgi:hypothetical protein
MTHIKETACLPVSVYIPDVIHTVIHRGGSLMAAADNGYVFKDMGTGGAKRRRIDDLNSAFSNGFGGKNSHHRVSAEFDNDTKLIPYYNQNYDGTIPVVDDLKVADDAMRACMKALLTETIKDNPICESTGDYPWKDGNYNYAAHSDMIWQLCVIMLGDWCVNGGLKLYKSTEVVNVYLGHTVSTAAQLTVRASDPVVYSTSRNSMVWYSSSTSVREIVSAFIDTLVRLRFFSAGDPLFLFPSTLIPSAIENILLRLLGDRSRFAKVSGWFPENMRYGMKRVRNPTRGVTAFGSHVITYPMQLPGQDWLSHFTAIKKAPTESDAEFELRCDTRTQYIKDHLPQIKCVKPDDDETPSIPIQKYYKADDESVESMISCVKAANAVLQIYVVDGIFTGDKEDAQEWVCDQIFIMLHNPAWCPNFMSTIGAQYLQSTCIEMQSAASKAARPDLPRAYYTTEEYAQATKSDDRRRIVTFIATLGVCLYDYVTKMVVLVGEPCSGKSAIISLMTRIVGEDYIGQLTKDYDQFTAASIFSPNTQLFVGEDTFDGPSNAPDAVKSVLGRPQDTVVPVAINPKGVQATKLAFNATGGITCRNRPEPTGAVGKTPYEVWQGAALGYNQGDERRSCPAEPMTTTFQDGTANPVDELGNLAYNCGLLEGINATEPAFVNVFMFLATSLSNSHVSQYGLCGDDGTDVLLDKIETYANKTKIDVGHILANSMHTEDTNLASLSYLGCKNTLVARPGVLLSNLKLFVIKEAGAPSSTKISVPKEYKAKRQIACATCGMWLSGVRTDDILPQIEKFKRKVPDHPFLTRPCPYNPSGYCIDSLQKLMVVKDHILVQSTE